MSEAQALIIPATLPYHQDYEALGDLWGSGRDEEFRLCCKEYSYTDISPKYDRFG